MEWLAVIGFILLISILLKKDSKNKTSGTVLPDQPKSYPPKPRPLKENIDLSDIKLSEDQQFVFDKIENTNNHYFITGKAGTGKSILLQYFTQKSEKKIIVCAPTGVAALNIGGQTIHSLFRLPPELISKEKLQPINYRVATLLRNIDTVVIDEISMVRADLMDAIDFRLRQARSNDQPFGGIQVIMFGDTFQLPPVVDDLELHKYFAEKFKGIYFFNATVWQETDFVIYELKTVFRHSDQNFIKILDSIRNGSISGEFLSQLNTRSAIEIPTNGVLTLATTNQKITEINEKRLSMINNRLFEFKAMIIGNLEPSSFPTEETLRLKKGAQVMLLRNDKEKRWVNGSIGFIHSLNEKGIKVDIDGFVYSIPKETWRKIRYYYNQEKQAIEEEVVSSFTQYPLRLAWAITIHKSQGQTFNKVAVDMGDGAFAHGQTYVALSRCTDLVGLYLKREIIQEDIIIDPVILEFMTKVKTISAKQLIKKKEK